jgi:hypothetical protein
LGGLFEISSDHKGTTLQVSIPISDQGDNVFTAPAFSQIYSSFAS